MPDPWIPERAITEEEAALLIAAQFPELAPVSLTLLGAGWDNTAFQVNESLVFRFPRRQLAVALLEAETRALPDLAGRLPLAIPEPLFVGRAAEAFPWPFAGYRMLPGRTACAAALSEEQRCAAAVPLARFLRALHHLPRAVTVSLALPGDTLGRLELRRRCTTALDLLEQAAREGLVEAGRPVREILEAAPEGFTPRSDTVVHGDLYARHLLVSASGRLTGVIDWGDLHRGDPAVDLTAVYTFLPPRARERFQEIYGEIAGETAAVARARAAWHTLWLLVYARRNDDADLLREATISLRHLTA